MDDWAGGKIIGEAIMFFIGDVHGEWKEYFKIIANLKGGSIQVGDFGFGFRADPPKWDLSHMFIRGNHDDPIACNDHPNCLGDYGVTEDGIFFVAGGYSIDWKWRQQHNLMNPHRPIWWYDEEISQDKFPAILEQFGDVKPDIVVAHDCPTDVKEFIATGGNIEDKKRFPNRTSDNLMPAMIEIHKPKVWVFGHYHSSTNVVCGGTRYIGLNELEVFNLDEWRNR